MEVRPLPNMAGRAHFFCPPKLKHAQEKIETYAGFESLFF